MTECTDQLPPRRTDRGWVPTFPTTIADRGIDRSAMWLALPADGTWISRREWQRRLGIEDIYHALFGQAVTAAEVSERKVIKNITHYRRRSPSGSEAHR